MDETVRINATPGGYPERVTLSLTREGGLNITAHNRTSETTIRLSPKMATSTVEFLKVLE